MVNTSKVLTVSYGTFSCTLEGFDDSFDTMKAIAEYFRDLAADDRYFGAEPPTPDADMLARIAEREVSRRVEAHRDGDKFVLRTALPVADIPTDAAEDQASTPDAQEAEQAQAEAEAEQARQEQAAKEAQEAKDAQARNEAREARRARIAEAQKAAEAAELEEKEKAAEAERLEKEEAAKAEADRLKAEQVEAKAKAEAIRLAKLQAEAKVQAEARAQAEAKAQEEARAEAQIKADRIAQQKARAAKREAEAEAAKQAEQDGNEPDSVAAKLARIRAVVGQPDAKKTAPDFTEDEHADDILQGQPGDTDLEDILDLDDADDDRVDTSDEETSVEGDDVETATKNAISGVMSKLNGNASKTVTPDDVAQDEELAEDLAETVEDVAEQPAAPAAPIRARVIKMKREEFEAAIASGDIEEEPEDEIASHDAEFVEAEDAELADTSLSRDDEAELARELAAVEAELEGLPADTQSQEAEPEYEAEPEQPMQLTNPVVDYPSAADDLAVEPEAEMDRLMDQTSSELEEPDGKKRRNALGHLRAAVASARAEKSARAMTAPIDETLTYRDDLQSAVQPRRPVRRAQAENAAPSAARPPLKLVAEQRVDSPEPAVQETQPVAPVRPRRVKAGGAATAPQPKPQTNEVAPEGGTFNEFAEELGATELPDLLEAAAAYLAYVEGRDQFSRPQLMTKVRMVQEENFSREDGLRSFGQLLRQGKIEKISGGRFTVSDRISFKPDTREAG